MKKLVVLSDSVTMSAPPQGISLMRKSNYAEELKNFAENGTFLDPFFDPRSEDNIFNGEYHVFAYSLNKDDDAFYRFCRELAKYDMVYYDWDKINIMDIQDMPVIYIGKSRFTFVHAGSEWEKDRKRFFFSNEDSGPRVQIGEVHYTDLNGAVEWLDYFDSLDEHVMYGFDYETNIMPLHEGFRITGFSLSTRDKSVWFDYRYPIEPDPAVRDAAYKRLDEFCVKNAHKMWAFNVSFEMAVNMHLFQHQCEFQDTRAALVCEGKTSGSLKYHAQRLLRVPGWKDSGDIFRNCATRLFEYYGDYEKFKVDLDTNFEALKEKNPELLKDIETMKSLGADWELFRVWWWEPWGVVPKKCLGYYCCLDSFYTIMSAIDLVPRYPLAYPCFIKNAWLGFELNAGGIPVNKDLVLDLEKKYAIITDNCRIILDQVMIRLNIMELSKTAWTEFTINPNLQKFIEDFGKNILDSKFPKYLLELMSTDSTILKLTKDSVMRYINDEALAERVLDIFGEYNEWETMAKMKRKRKEYEYLGYVIEEYIHLNDERRNYNKLNMNKSYEAIKNAVNSKKTNILNAVYTKVDQDNIKMDKFDELYAACSKMTFPITKEQLLPIIQYLNTDDIMVANGIAIKTVKNKGCLDFKKILYVDKAYEDYLINCNQFHPEAAKLLGLSSTNPEHKSKIEALFKFFRNFDSYIDYMHNKPELNRYSDMESYPITYDGDYVTYNMQKTLRTSIAGIKGNYQSPETKQYLTWKLPLYYDRQFKYGAQKYFKFFDYVQTLEEVPEDKREYAQANKTSEGFPVRYEPKYKEFCERYKTDERYKKWVNEQFWWDDEIAVAFGDFVHANINESTIDWKNLSINLFDYEDDEFNEFMVVMACYMYQSGCSKELNGYLRGSGNGLLMRSHPVIDEVDGYWMKGNENAKKKYSYFDYDVAREIISQDDRKYVFEADWHINEKATKRWSSG